MSGIELLFDTAIEYERTHQLALYTLFCKSNFIEFLVGSKNISEVFWEPEGQLFDLAIITPEEELYFEIKMWSSLTEYQLDRQAKFLLDAKSVKRRLGVYILFGTTGYEYNSNETLAEGSAIKVGYKELIDSLNKLLVSPDCSSEIAELTLAYRNALQIQYEKLNRAAFSPDRQDKRYFYSLFAMIQQNLDNIRTNIYTVNNKGGEVYILNNVADSVEIIINDINVTVYYEVVNNRLCVKFNAKTDDDNIKYKIRDMIRNSVHAVLGNIYKIVNTGRIGKYMTACQIDYDFADVTKVQSSARVFLTVHDEFPSIIEHIKYQLT